MAPKRKRNLILEDRSRRLFEDALPEEWVVRKIDKDYGIDVEVEIFEAEETTGLTFKVQLKSTADVKGKTPSQKASISHLEYWLSLDVPVMIVLYVESTGRFYYRWASSHDPGIGGWARKSTTISFDESADRIDTRSDQIQEEVKLLRAVRHHRLPRPIPLRLSCKIPGISQARLVQITRARIRQCQLHELITIVVDQQSQRCSPRKLNTI